MADAILSTILGGAQIQSVSTGAAAQNATNIPPAIAKLPIGSLIKGFVINRDPSNNPILRTDRGDVLVKSDTFLKTGSEVVIRVNYQGNQQQARIVSIDGQSLQQVQDQQNLASKSSNQDKVMPSSLMPGGSSSAAFGSGNQPAQPTITLNAVMLQPSSISSGSNAQTTIANILNIPPANVPVLDKGVSLQFKVVNSQLNLSQPATSTTTQPTTTAPAGAPSSPSRLTAAQYQAYAQQGGAKPTTSTPSPSPATVLPQSSTPSPAANAAAAANHAATSSTLTSTGLAPSTSANVNAAATATTGTAATPTTTQSTAPQPYAPTATNIASAANSPPIAQPQSHNTNSPPAAAGTISARVIGVESNGATIVRTPIGTVKLFTASPPPMNSVLQMELVFNPTKPNTANMTTTTVAPPAVSTFSALSHDWRALEEAQRLLAQINNPAMSEALMHRIPNTKSKMVNSVLFFLSALKQGGVKQWLGNRVASELENKSPNLFKQLSSDFEGLRTMVSERTDQSWQMLLFPLMHDEKLHQARMFIRDDEQGNEKGQNGTRFVVEITMSILGDIQLDGLVRKQNQAFSFDLTVHSAGNLPNTMQTEIEHIFNEAKEVSRFAGSIRFDSNPDRFIHPLQDIQNRYDPNDDQSILA